MHILFEEHPYPTEKVKDIVGEELASGVQLKQNIVQLKYVGYYFNPQLNDGKGDIVYILPKVFLSGDDEETVFGIKPEDERFLNFNPKEWKKVTESSIQFKSEADDNIVLSKNKVFEFFHGFTTWLYRAINVYRHNHAGSGNKDKNEEAEAVVYTSIKYSRSGSQANNTWMEVILALLEYAKKNKDYITFILKTVHSGYNKINWSKTVSRSNSVIQDDEVFYMNPVNRKRVVNHEEELFVIFYSILNYLLEEYGFALISNVGYETIKGKQFDKYMKGYGKKRLRQIKYKYFSDRFLELWQLCYDFFDKAERIHKSTDNGEYLLVSSFHYVFEDMVDELISDKNLPDNLKNQKDDKRIDHLFTYRYLIEQNSDAEKDGMNDKMYYIGDSKFYKRNSELKGHDVPKQFTYARNVTLWHMMLLQELAEKGTPDDKKARGYNEIQLYDSITKGYNIIPNFFISTKVDDNLDYSKHNFDSSKLGETQQYSQSYSLDLPLFKDSTLFALHYDVNFLYILKKYSRKKASEYANFRRDIRKKCRDSFVEFLDSKYTFYQVMIPNGQISSFVEDYFYALDGLVFSFIPKKTGGRVLLFAQEKEPKIQTDLLEIDGQNLTVKKQDGRGSYTIKLSAPFELKSPSYEMASISLPRDLNEYSSKGIDVKKDIKYDGALQNISSDSKLRTEVIDLINKGDEIEALSILQRHLHELFPEMDLHNYAHLIDNLRQNK